MIRLLVIQDSSGNCLLLRCLLFYFIFFLSFSRQYPIIYVVNKRIEFIYLHVQTVGAFVARPRWTFSIAPERKNGSDILKRIPNGNCIVSSSVRYTCIQCALWELHASRATRRATVIRSVVEKALDVSTRTFKKKSQDRGWTGVTEQKCILYSVVLGVFVILIFSSSHAYVLLNQPPFSFRPIVGATEPFKKK